jgi:hypothetical protein
MRSRARPSTLPVPPLIRDDGSSAMHESWCCTTWGLNRGNAMEVSFLPSQAYGDTAGYNFHPPTLAVLLAALCCLALTVAQKSINLNRQALPLERPPMSLLRLLQRRFRIDTGSWQGASNPTDMWRAFSQLYRRSPEEYQRGAMSWKILNYPLPWKTSFLTRVNQGPNPAPVADLFVKDMHLNFSDGDDPRHRRRTKSREFGLLAIGGNPDRTRLSIFCM